MATLSGPPANAIRNKPIQARLAKALSESADDAGIDHVRISSGGQDAKGHGTRRTGSTRHDIDATGKGGAADLELLIGGRVLNFQNMADRPIIARFVTGCSRRGCTGIGAGVDYMGPTKLHVGYGAPATWGGPNARSKDAPAWLVAAVAAARQPLAPRTLKRGDKGEDVGDAQRALNDRGADPKLADDDDYGGLTETAVKAFQIRAGLPVSGVIDTATRRKLGL